MHYVRRFHSVILKGVPANVLEVMDLTEARTLLWARYIDHTRLPPSPDQRHILRLDNLTHLTLHSVVRRQWDNGFAPRLLLKAPNLVDINLISLIGSTEAWDVKALFATGHTFRKKEVSLVLHGCIPIVSQARAANHTTLPLESSHLASVSSVLKTLVVCDYAPLFLYQPELPFTKLVRLTVDISELPTTLVQSQTSIDIQLENHRFLRLEVLSITQSITRTALETYLNTQRLCLQLPDGVKELRVARFLAGSLKSLLINGVDICPSVRETSSPSMLTSDHVKFLSWTKDSSTRSFNTHPPKVLFVKRLGMSFDGPLLV